MKIRVHFVVPCSEIWLMYFNTTSLISSTSLYNALKPNIADKIAFKHLCQLSILITVFDISKTLPKNA